MENEVTMGVTAMPIAIRFLKARRSGSTPSRERSASSSATYLHRIRRIVTNRRCRSGRGGDEEIGGLDQRAHRQLVPVDLPEERRARLHDAAPVGPGADAASHRGFDQRHGAQRAARGCSPVVGPQDEGGIDRPEAHPPVEAGGGRVEGPDGNAVACRRPRQAGPARGQLGDERQGARLHVEVAGQAHGLAVAGEDQLVALDLVAVVEETQGEGRLAGALAYYLLAVDHVVTTSALDAAALRGRYGDTRVTAVPNAVRIAPRPPASPTPPATHDLVFVGTLSYGPNVDAARWLCERVLPLVPEATVALVGSNPPEQVRALARDPRVTVVGSVPDVAAWYERSRVAVVPLLAQLC